MSILYLFAALIAVLAGFIGLVIIIKGFVDKNNKNINLGTILVSVALIIAMSGAYCIGRRAIHSKRYHDHERMMMQNCMKNCMRNCDMEMMHGCGMGDSTAMSDSNGMKIVTKVIMDKNCKMDGKKCDGKCKHGMH
jgi:hypothetical protein